MKFLLALLSMSTLAFAASTHTEGEDETQVQVVFQDDESVVEVKDVLSCCGSCNEDDRNQYLASDEEDRNQYLASDEEVTQEEVV